MRENGKYLLIILVVNAILLGLLGNRGPSTSREALGLFAMANIAQNKQAALPAAFEQYPEVIKTSNGKCIAPQPLWFQLAGSISYKISKVFFGVNESLDGLKRYYRVASFLGNLLASSLLIFTFSQGIFVKGLTGKEYLVLILPLAFFSLAFTGAMVLESHLWVATLAFWSLNFINGGIYFINRDVSYHKSFILAGLLLGFAGCLSLPAIGLGIGFLWMFITQKEKRFQRAAVDILAGAIPPILLTAIVSIIYTHQSGAYIPPWPEIARMNGVTPGIALRYLIHSTLGLNGFFIYSPIALIGAIALVRRLSHFQIMAEKRKKLDFYARGQALLTWGVYGGGIIAFFIFWLVSIMNGIPPNFNPDQLKMVQYSIGGDKFFLPALSRPYGSPELLFLLPVLHYFNLHIFRERPFVNLRFYYHELVRIGALIAWIGLASPTGGYVVPLVWALNKIALFMTNFYPQGTLLW